MGNRRGTRGLEKSQVTLGLKKGTKEDPGNCRPVSLSSIPAKVMEQLMLNVISTHVEEKKVTRSSQRGCSKGKSCSANVLGLRDGMTAWGGEGRAEVPVCPDSSRALVPEHPLREGGEAEELRLGSGLSTGGGTELRGFRGRHRLHLGACNWCWPQSCSTESSHDLQEGALPVEDTPRALSRDKHRGEL